MRRCTSVGWGLFRFLMARMNIRKLNVLTANVEYFNEHVLRMGMISNPHITSRGMDSNAKQKDDEGKTEPLTVAEILAIHEGGRSPMPNNPARAPITITMRDRAADYQRELSDFLTKMFKGEIAAEFVLAAVGETVVQLFRETVKKGLPPALTEERKKAKRRHGGPADTPLIMGGQLQGSWRYEIKEERI